MAVKKYLNKEYEENKNKRYFPLDKLYLKKMEYCIYGALQYYSERNCTEIERYVYKRKISFSKLEKELGITRKTISKRIKDMIEEGLIDFKILNNGESVYYLPCKDTKYLLLNLDFKDIKKLVFGTNDNVFRVYLLLKHRAEYLKSIGKKAINMEIDQTFICQQIGLSKNSRRLILTYIETLKDLGFLSIKMETISSKSIVKTKYLYTVLK